MKRILSTLPLTVGILAAGLTAVPASAIAASQQPNVHVVEKRTAPSLGAVFLAQKTDTARATAGSATVTFVGFEKICRVPCGVPVDLVDNPLFFFVRDGHAVSRDFRIPDLGEDVTLRYTPARRGLRGVGLAFSWLLIGIPLLIAGRPRVHVAHGRPEDVTEFAQI